MLKKKLISLGVSGFLATGIGCFFDDEMHALLGLRGTEWQSLYHFTAGGAVDDARLTTLPAYSAPERCHRRGARQERN